MESNTQPTSLSLWNLGVKISGTANEDHPELRSYVKVEVIVLGSPSLISLMVSVDVKQHLKKGPFHNPSITYRHFPPNAARIGYATEGALFISAQLSADVVSALRKVWALIRLWKQHRVQARI